MKANRFSLMSIFACKVFLRDILMRWMVSGFIWLTIHGESAEALLMDTFDLKAQDKHLHPMHLIKLSSILRKEIKIKQGYTKWQVINEVFLFMLSSWITLENKQLKKSPTLKNTN